MSNIKINRVIHNLYGFVPSAREPHIEALEASGLADELTAKQLTTIVRLMQQAYQNGKAHAGAEKIDTDAVWVNGVGAIERQPDGSWKLTMPDKGVDKSAAAAALGAVGGKATSEAKVTASRENGKKGGRPRKQS
jgi:hypothetical protein